MDLAFSRLETILASDPGKRGIEWLALPGSLQLAAAALVGAKRVAIATGFFIVAASACESDGPPGAWALGEALHKLGASAVYLTDSFCLPALSPFDFAQVKRYPAFSPEDSLDDFRPTHLVSVERLGRAADGRYYSMRGVNISDWTAPIDELFLQSSERGIVTLGIGDGGNEIGMGKVHQRVVDAIANGPTIASVVSTDHLIVGGTSNWGAWGLVAGMSLLAGRNLLPTVAEAFEQLQRLVAQGAVDGVTGRPEPTVDGLPWEQNAAVLQDLHDVVSAAVGQQS